MLFRKRETISTLDDVLNSSWRLLHKGVRDFRHPFNRSALTTINGNMPEVRTVILRGFSEKDRTLICHCDVRSPKVSQILESPNASWLFYHPKKWIQLRLSGTATVHTDDNTAESHWKKVRQTSRINYCAEIPPGSPTEKPTSGLPEFLRDKASKLFDHSEARKNFAVIVCTFDQMDWLELKLTGHRRAKFHWEDNRMGSSWVIP
jgi:pyridoxamine 5'-phosphate oxidase